MTADELFRHALTSLPEAVGDLLRDGRDPNDVIFTSFDGASELGRAVISTELAMGAGVDGSEAHSEVVRMLLAAGHRGEELVVSLMVTKDVLARILGASHIDDATRVAVRLWLEDSLRGGCYRVVAIAGGEVRAAIVDGGGADEEEEAVPSSSMLN